MLNEFKSVRGQVNARICKGHHSARAPVARALQQWEESCAKLWPCARAASRSPTMKSKCALCYSFLCATYTEQHLGRLSPRHPCKPPGPPPPSRPQPPPPPSGTGGPRRARARACTGDRYGPPARVETLCHFSTRVGNELSPNAAPNRIAVALREGHVMPAAENVVLAEHIVGARGRGGGDLVERNIAFPLAVKPIPGAPCGRVEHCPAEGFSF